MNLTQICDESSCGQVEFPRILSQNGQNDLEDQVRWPTFSIPAESIPGYKFDANLVIPAYVTSYRADKVKLTDRQTSRQTDGQTDRRTDGQTPATTIPLRPERPRGKNRLRGGGHFVQRVIGVKCCHSDSQHWRQGDRLDLFLLSWNNFNHSVDKK